MPRHFNNTGILSLPFDVLLHIFTFIVRGPLNQMSDTMPFPFIASRVCRQWNEIVYNAPSVWTSVCLSPKSPFDANRFLERSNDSLISLSIIFPDNSPSSEFIKDLKHLLPPHSERIKDLYIYHCDCRKEEVFATVGILSRFPTVNLTVFEILEDYDLIYFCYKRGVTRAIPRTGLPWGQNLKRVSAPGSWLHMLVSGPRPFITTVETDDAFLSKNSFRTMVNNMPMLTTLILRNENNVYQGFINRAPLTYIKLPSLKLLRLEYYDFHRVRADDRHQCFCLPGRLVTPNLEVLECSSGVNDLSTRTEYRAPLHCLLNQESLKYYNSSSTSLRKIRLENVNAPYESLNRLHILPHLELVFDFNSVIFSSEANFVPFAIPKRCERLTFDVSNWSADLASTLLLYLTNDLSRDGTTLNTLNLHIPSSFSHTTLSQVIQTFGTEVVRVSQEATSRSSQGCGSNDDLGHLARHETHLRALPPFPGSAEPRDKRHTRLSPKPSMDGMHQAYSSEFGDSDSDEEWSY